MNKGQYDKAQIIQRKLCYIDMLKKFYESDNRYVIAAAVVLDIEDADPVKHGIVKLPLNYQKKVLSIVEDYKKELEKEFEEI